MKISHKSLEEFLVSFCFTGIITLSILAYLGMI